MPVYDDVNLLDIAGPREMFNWMRLPGGEKAELWLIADAVREVTTIDGLKFQATKKFSDVEELDVLWVPGGQPLALAKLMFGPNSEYRDFLIRVSPTARFVCSVCEGALLLAAAGLLDGYEATTHWDFVACLKKFRNVKVVDGNPRFVIDRNRVTGGGISSGLDEALKLVELLASTAEAQRVQLTTQYFPDPPVTGVIPQSNECNFPFLVPH